MKVFCVINSLSKEAQDKFLPDHDDPIKLANEFGSLLKTILITFMSIHLILLLLKIALF